MNTICIGIARKIQFSKIISFQMRMKRRSQRKMMEIVKSKWILSAEHVWNMSFNACSHWNIVKLFKLFAAVFVLYMAYANGIKLLSFILCVMSHEPQSLCMSYVVYCVCALYGKQSVYSVLLINKAVLCDISRYDIVKPRTWMGKQKTRYIAK